MWKMLYVIFKDDQLEQLRKFTALVVSQIKYILIRCYSIWIPLWTLRFGYHLSERGTIIMFVYYFICPSQIPLNFMFLLFVKCLAKKFYFVTDENFMCEYIHKYPFKVQLMNS